MISIKKIMAAIIAALSAALAVVIAVLTGKKRELEHERKENARLESDNNRLASTVETIHDEMNTQNTVTKESVAVREETNEKIQSTNTGNVRNDFDASLAVLHDIAGRKKGK